MVTSSRPLVEVVVTFLPRKLYGEERETDRKTERQKDREGKRERARVLVLGFRVCVDYLLRRAAPIKDEQI